MTIHATAVAINGRAVLLKGKSGAGKSDLALRLLALPRDALRAFGQPVCDVRLIADDRVIIEKEDRQLIAKRPPVLHGKLEVRGVGIIDVSHVMDSAPLALLVTLAAPQDVPRLPEADHEMILDIAVPVVHVAPFEASAPLKIALALSARHPSE